MVNQEIASTDTGSGWFIGLTEAVYGNISGLFGPASRFYLPYLLLSAIIAAGAFYLNRRHLAPRGKTRLLPYLFDCSVFFNASSLVDIKVILANRLFVPFLMVASRAATVIAAYEVARLFTGGDLAPPSATPGLAALAAMTVAVTLTSDFTSYWVHRLHHENPVFWPFHKVHHSAETLTPLTFARKHPVYDLIRALSNGFLVGPAQGLVFALFGVSDIVTILGANAFYAVFYWSGANLRHSHIWLSYGPVLNRILISPAQHQIHHSCAERHHDKNYGEIFALWDWMFGTLYTPIAYEDLEFGVADAAGRRLAQPHPTLKAAMLVPFRECGEALGRKDRPLPPTTEPGAA